MRRVDVEGCKNVLWSGTQSLVAIISDDGFYVLRFDRDAYDEKLEENGVFTSFPRPVLNVALTMRARWP